MSRSTPSFTLTPPPVLAAIDAVAARHFAAAERNPRALSEAVARVSGAYTRRGAALDTLQGDDAALYARLRFFLPRDLPKLWGPLGELLRADALPAGTGPLRVLDLGAGLGTTGLAAAWLLARGPHARPLEITAVDSDRRALQLLRALYAACADAFDAEVRVQTHLGRVDAPRATTHDLVLAGLVLNEALEEQHDALAVGETMLRGWAGTLGPDGALIVLEPALRPQSRRLQALRTAFTGAGAGPFLFAPCTHREACPLLQRERDWCHDLLPAALPAPLAKVAADAGLRDTGLSYSYLTLHAQDRSLADIAPGATLWRGVSAALGSKGKTELSLCGRGQAMRLMQLDRKRRTAPLDVATLGRGTLLEIEMADTDPTPAQLRLDRAPALRVRQTWSDPDTFPAPRPA